MDLHPRVAGLLKSVAPAECSHLHYSLRHPGAIFNLTFHQVLLALDGVVVEVLRGGDADYDGLALRHLTLLLALNSYSEAFYEMLLASSKPDIAPPDNLPLWQWLRERKYRAAAVYYEALRNTDAVYFRNMFNALKHSSSTLRIFRLLTSEQVLNGYYVESGSASGAIGPDDRFHPLWQGKYTANSFMRDLRRVHHLVYLIAEAMASGLLLHYQEVYGRELKPVPWSSPKNNQQPLLDNVCRLPRKFFPHEAGLWVPYVSLEEQASTAALVFSEERAPVSTARYKFEYRTFGDGYTRAFTLPFFVGGQV